MNGVGLTRATTRTVGIGIALMMAVVATVPAQVIKSVHGDRVQLAVDLARFAVYAQVFATESSALSIAVTRAGMNAIRSMHADPGGASGYGFGEMGRIGFRAYPFLGDPSRLLAGISVGVEASFSAGHRYYDPGNDLHDLPISGLAVVGGTLSPSVGVSTKLFGWLFLEIAGGTGLTVRRVTSVTGDYYTAEIGDTAIGLVLVGSLKVGASF